MRNLGESCILEKRSCTRCGECDLCDLDPSKQCDNCCQCINTLEGDYIEIKIDDILLNSEKLKTRHSKNQNKYKIKPKL